MVKVEQPFSPEPFIGLLNQIVAKLVVDELEGALNDHTQNQVRSFTVCLIIFSSAQCSQKGFHHTNTVLVGPKLDQTLNTQAGKLKEHRLGHQLDELPHEVIAIFILHQKLEVGNQELSYFLKLVRSGQQRDE